MRKQYSIRLLEKYTRKIQVTTAKGRTKTQEYRNNKLSRNDEPKNNTYKRYMAFKTDK